MNSKITVIIPTYNSSLYIKDCIDSILNQTFQNFEIIVVNDGSTDDTLEIVKSIRSDKIKLIDNVLNNGQGYVRNQALKEATGDYIMFVDSDDFLEPVTFEVALKRIIKDKSDFVYFDWKYYKESINKYQYVSKEDFFDKKVLINNECKQLLKIQHYFTVNKLYDRKFLIDKEVLYGEHYIYEDIIFWTKAVMNAKKVSIIHSPLYNVRINRVSTTKTNYDTSKHLDGFLRAFDEGIELFSDNSREKYWFLNYMFKKFLLYYSSRIPKNMKKYFASEFYRRIHKYNINMLLSKTRYARVAIFMKIFDSINRFRIFLSIYSMKKYYKKVISVIKRIKNKIKNLFKKNINLEYYKKKDKLKKQVLFMGFDYRYTGSSRYLFEEMLKNKNNDVYFVTDNELVEKNKRITPNSLEFYEKLYSSKIVIFESWIQNKFYKPKDAIWINLWHGTPLKKMLFDSNEEEIIKVRPNHKKEKFTSISKIDYLLTDNEYVKKYFKTSFLIDDSKIISYGYPRVKYLLENKNNEILKESIRKKLNISNYKKIILYLPTWRDYNYNIDDLVCDFDYFLDKEKLISFLGDKEYAIVSKDHAFLRKAKNVSVTDVETQELLLVSDYVLTDYSSVMFDAFALNIPVCLIAKDCDKYLKSRGLYEDIWSDLQYFVVNNEEDLAILIKNYKITKEYKNVKEKYCYKSSDDLVEFIENKLN